MMRRVFAGFAVVGLLLMTTNNTAPISAQLLRPALAIFFLAMLFVQAWPMMMTLRGHFGKRRHPANKMYSYFAGLGIIGTLGVALVVFLNNKNGDLDFVLILAGPLMFLGIVASAVLAFFATPWRDWTYHEPHPDEESVGATSRAFD